MMIDRCRPLMMLLAAGGMLGLTSGTMAADVANYSIEDLLSPCVEADNDARWGAAAEAECEQYIVGYTDAFVMLAEAAGEQVCLPEQNRADEVRWAFMKWATQNYGQRSRPAAEGLLETLNDAFKCQ